jgi:hypothetical protein
MKCRQHKGTTTHPHIHEKENKTTRNHPSKLTYNIVSSQGFALEVMVGVRSLMMGFFTLLKILRCDVYINVCLCLFFFMTIFGMEVNNHTLIKTYYVVVNTNIIIPRHFL